VTLFLPNVTPQRCECGKFDLARPGHTLHRIHVNNFIEREDEAETHSRKKCWPSKAEAEPLTGPCACAAYMIGASDHYVLYVEWGRWVEYQTGNHKYTYSQETHKQRSCIGFLNGERVFTRGGTEEG
jgi:hypothetical protein